MNNITKAANNFKKAKQTLEETRRDFVQKVIDVVADNPNGIYANDIAQMTDGAVSTQAVVGALLGAGRQNISSMRTVRAIKFVQLNEDGTINPNKSIVVKTMVRKYYTPENKPITNFF